MHIKNTEQNKYMLTTLIQNIWNSHSQIRGSLQPHNGHGNCDFTDSVWGGR